MIKVLFVSNSDDQYGSSKSLMGLLTEIKKDGLIEPILLTPIRNKLNDNCDSLGIENFVVKYQNVVYNKNDKFVITLMRRMAYFLQNKFALKKIKWQLRNSNIDLVHTNTTVVGIGQAYASNQKIPHIQHIREFLDSDFNLVFFDKNYLKKTSKNNNYIAISKIIEEYWIKQGLNMSNIEVIYNGVATQERKVKDFKQQKLCFTFVGAITPNKGQYELLTALTFLEEKLINQIEVDFWGTGQSEYLEELKRFCDTNQLNNVVSFKGYNSNISNMLKDYHVGIVSSKKEGFGRVTAEFMINTMCVIASDTGANPELITDLSSGCLYQSGNPKKLSEKITFVLENREQASEMANVAYDEAFEKYSVDLNAQRMTQKIMQIIETNR